MITVKQNRSVTVPESDRHIGFVNDNLVEQRLFEIQDSDLFDFTFKLDIENTSDVVNLVQYSRAESSLILKCDITSSMIGSGGVIRTQLRAFDSDSEKVWHSGIIEFTADASVNAVNSINEEHTVSEFEQTELQIQASATAAAASASTAASSASEASAYVQTAATYSNNAEVSCTTAAAAASSAQSYMTAAESSKTAAAESATAAAESATAAASCANLIDAELSDTSEKAVQNKAVKAALDGKADTTHSHSAATPTRSPKYFDLNNYQISDTGNDCSITFTGEFNIIKGTNANITLTSTNGVFDSSREYHVVYNIFGGSSFVMINGVQYTESGEFDGLPGVVLIHTGHTEAINSTINVSIYEKGVIGNNEFLSTSDKARLDSVIVTENNISEYTNISVYNNNIYNAGEKQYLSLNFNYLSMKSACATAEIIFTSGTTPTSINYPSSIIFKGADCNSAGVFIPSTSKTYSVMFGYNGKNIYGLTLAF